MSFTADTFYQDTLATSNFTPADWTVNTEGGNVYYYGGIENVPRDFKDLRSDTTLTYVDFADISDIDDLSAGSWTYDASTYQVYVHLADDADPGSLSAASLTHGGFERTFYTNTGVELGSESILRDQVFSSIGAFEPLYYTMVTSKGDDSGLFYTNDDAATYFDAALGGSGLTLREAFYWLDTYNRDTAASLTNTNLPGTPTLYDPDRYIKFDFVNTFSTDGDNTISLSHGDIRVGGDFQGNSFSKYIVVGAVPETADGFRDADAS